MISAIEANIIASKKEGYTFNIKEAVEEQLSLIDKEIRQIANNGGYTVFYEGALYNEVVNTLKQNGYTLTNIFNEKYGVQIYVGVNIQWN